MDLMPVTIDETGTANRSATSNPRARRDYDRYFRTALDRLHDERR